MIKEHFNYDINKFLIEYDKLHPNAPKASKDNFYYSLKRIEKIYNKPLPKIKLEFIFNLTDFLRKLNDNDFSFNTIYATMSSISKLIKIINPELKIEKEIREIMNKLIDKRNNINLEQVKNIKEQTNWINYKNIIRKLDNELTNFLFDEVLEVKYRNFLILNLMIREFPVRLGNFSDMYIKEKIPFQSIKELDKDKNYIIKNNDESFIFVFNKYKTSKTYGTIIQPVENETNIELLKHYFEIYEPTIYFLRNNQNKLLSSKSLGDALGYITKELLGKKLSVDMIRHIYITHFMEQNPKLRDKINLADLMGHNLQQQELYKRY